MMGVDYELFWTMNPKELTPFIKAFELKRQYDDILSWQQGIYIKLAIASSLSKDIKYPKTPMCKESAPVTPEQRQQTIKQRFMNHIAQINAKFEREN